MSLAVRVWYEGGHGFDCTPINYALVAINLAMNLHPDYLPANNFI